MSAQYQDRQANCEEYRFDQMRLNFEMSIQKFGIPQPIASDMAKALLTTMRKMNKGSAIYFSDMTRKELEEKKSRFCTEFNGANRDQLCKKYGISDRTSDRWLSWYRKQNSSRVNSS